MRSDSERVLDALGASSQCCWRILRDAHLLATIQTYEYFTIVSLWFCLFSASFAPKWKLTNINVIKIE